MDSADPREKAPGVGTQAALVPAAPLASPAEASTTVTGGNTDVPDEDELGLAGLLPLAIPEIEQKRGSGRPKGAQNIRTNKTFTVAVSRYGDPLIASIALGNMPTRDLIRELRMIASDCGLKLGASVMDVLRFQEECRRNAMPYGHGKRAPVDDTGKTVDLPIIGIGRIDATFVAAARSIEDEIEARMKTVEHQDVSDADKA